MGVVRIVKMQGKFYDVRTLLHRVVKETEEMRGSGLGLEDYYGMWKGFAKAVIAALH